MKKILAFLLVLTFVFTMSACGKSNETNDTTDYTTGNNSSSLVTDDTSDEESDGEYDSEDTATESEDIIDPDFKAAMDSYEEFMDGYVDILKKYSKNPTDTSILTKYTEYMGKYADMVAKFEKWEDEDLNDVELKYYIEVQGRVSKKLAQVAG